MTITYKLPTEDSDKSLESNVAVLKLVTGKNPLYIPKAEGNTDYQEYLEWVAAGNTAEAAD
tara:strand:- start:254 stop:436 length:183 start_codon:yes stop_codon:yes gene_type:complete